MPKSFPDNDQKGYYACLGLQPGATAALIRAAYKVRAMELHPDRNPGATATSEFQKLQEAYDALSNDEKRSAYDAMARDRQSASPTSSSRYSGAGSSPQASPGPRRTKPEHPNQEKPSPVQKTDTSAFTKVIFLATMPALVLVVYVGWDSVRTPKREAESRQWAEMARVAQADAEKAVELERRERLEAKAAAERQRADELAALEKPLPDSGVLWGSSSYQIYLLTIGRSEGHMARFRVTAALGVNYMLKLIDANFGEPLLTIFVRAGQTAEVEIPPGDYKLKMAAGEKWYGSEMRFGPDTQYTEVSERVSFSANGEQVSGLEINLSRVLNGNLRPAPIEPSSF